uniref:Uncharacterized protein LOC111123002 isoform X1 n=1 Tax=Crassostrea virginica TaxID=6565 RepID=A0A8B8D1Y0_CRAVI|nr:uncharacterized protein LOC111123002 isoform X1 [Crassostrea virginica]
MTVSTRFYSMCVLLVALFISFQGAFGQSLECSTKLLTCLNGIQAADREDKKDLCKAEDTFFSCVENAIEQCGLGKDVMDKAKEEMANYKCSAPGLPTVSALCLLMAALFHMLS